MLLYMYRNKEIKRFENVLEANEIFRQKCITNDKGYLILSQPSDNPEASLYYLIYDTFEYTGSDGKSNIYHVILGEDYNFRKSYMNLQYKRGCYRILYEHQKAPIYAGEKEYCYYIGPRVNKDPHGDAVIEHWLNLDKCKGINVNKLTKYGKDIDDVNNKIEELETNFKRTISTDVAKGLLKKYEEVKKIMDDINSLEVETIRSNNKMSKMRYSLQNESDLLNKMRYSLQNERDLLNKEMEIYRMFKSDCKKEIHACCICMDEKKNVLFRKCGHICCCQNCYKKIDQCPICRAPDIEDTQIVYL